MNFLDHPDLKTKKAEPSGAANPSQRNALW